MKELYDRDFPSGDSNSKNNDAGSDKKELVHEKCMEPSPEVELSKDEGNMPKKLQKVAKIKCGTCNETFHGYLIYFYHKVRECASFQESGM